MKPEDTKRRLSEGALPHESLFKRRIERVPPGPFKQAVGEVCDTAELCLAWLLDWNLNPAAADVIALTDLVLQHSRSRE